ncbi:hypothetical protein [Flavobacterium branchiophilum]|uniref:Uncharacterized protein n=1 Tax=Flavobacterium branchiophilum TaxID=55197 RepID=A0A2H3K9I7_9FLAO|nr:hypothetical protein [Flavobacterium branchiophilum]PDS22831.1 hypothetical protein B0A77_12225 [Flavobacterium branchiophilum]
MKKPKLLLSLLLLTAAGTYAQVGVGTTNPQGIFNVDGGKDNASSGTPTTAQQANDLVVLSTGNVGIGTTSPLNKLVVKGTNNQPSAQNVDATNAILRVDGSSNHALDFGVLANSPYGAYIQSQNKTGATGLPLALNPSAGKVGIGTVDPSEALTVITSTNAADFGLFSNVTVPPTSDVMAAQIKLGHSKDWFTGIRSILPSGSANTGLLDLQLTTGTASSDNTQVARLTVKAVSGNVGIGTTNPNAKLDVRSDLKEVARFTSSKTLTDFAHIALGNDTGVWAKLAAGSGAFAIRNYTTDATVFYTDLATGSTGIGTASPSTKLEVDSGTANDSGFKMTKLTSLASTSSNASVAAIGVDSTGKVVPLGSSKRTDGVATNGTVDVAVSTFGCYQVTVSGSFGGYRTFTDQYIVSYANNFTVLSVKHINTVYSTSNGGTHEVLATSALNVANATLAPGHGIYNITFVCAGNTNVISAKALVNTEILSVKTQMMW